MSLQAADFESLAISVGVRDFDLMLVGDGSGTRLVHPCGWSCMSYYRPSGRMKAHYGGTSGGTNNYAELAPYIHVLWAFHAVWQERYPGKQPDSKVLIVSDSELTVRCGSGEYGRKANLALWASVDWFVSVGYKLIWRHVPRNSNPLSKRADALARKIRKCVS